MASACRLAATSEAGDAPWKFYFKLYCFLDTDSMPKDSVEFAFMFEQVKGTPRDRFFSFVRDKREKPITAANK